MTTTDAFARASDPGTSHAAARRVARSRLENEVYSFMAKHYSRNWAALEIARAIGEHAWSVSPRLQPLALKGYIQADGTRKVINTHGKMRTMQVWRVIKI